MPYAVFTVMKSWKICVVVLGLCVQDARRHEAGELSVAKPEYMKEYTGRDDVIILKWILDGEGVDWIEMGSDKFHWLTFVNTVMSLRTL